MLKDKDKRSSFNGILQGIEYYVVLLRFLLYLKIKTSEAHSTAFYKGLSEKNKDKRSAFNGILQGFE
ncbi:hypothetical protein T4B_3112 [Trichinella pseudospiralis]|uniref:Uncharacterized protein n=1 Tax=Trichinella pseudospiralis TaxID=6337 RepID=A0A0V1GF20_TRIPS|nr:hypothetical protein T4B_3112 [Trichinella pseudospiralis]